MISSIAPALGSGALVGLTLGLIGGGGSILATPLLLYGVGVPDPHVAIGTSAFAVSISAFLNLIGHARAGHVRWICALVFAAIGSVGALLGSTLGKMVDANHLLILFALEDLDLAMRGRSRLCLLTCASVRKRPSTRIEGRGIEFADRRAHTGKPPW